MADAQGSPLVGLERPGGIARRAPGCVVGFIAFTLLLTAGDYLTAALPTLVLQVLAIVGGLGLGRLYAVIARRRWQIDAPDAIALLAMDLSSFRRFYVPADYRLSFVGTWSWRERLLHELLYAAKWLGHLLVFAGFGTLIYSLMVQFGLVDPTVPQPL